MKTLNANPRNGKSPKIKLLLVDDHEIALEALKLYFSVRSNFDVAAMVVDRLDTIQNARKKAPDVVMMNMRMLQVDAAAATKRLLETLPKTKVIGFSGLEDRKVILPMIRAGARGYLLKGCSARELFRAVETVNSGATFFSASVSKMIQEDYLQSLSMPAQNKTGELRECERKILTMIADGLSNKEIAGALTMSVRTIEKYRETLIAKLQIKSIAGLTKFAIRNGIARLD